jgi:membrane protein required for colicin V production
MFSNYNWEFYNTMENFSLLDLVSIILILVLGIKGLFRGFVKEAFGLVGIVGGIYVASRYAEGAGKYIDVNFLNLENKASLYLIGFIAVFMLFWVIAAAIGALLGGLVSSSGLGFLDKILGFFVGGAKIFLIFSIIIYVLSNIPIFKYSVQNLFKGSFMYPIYLQTGAEIIKLDNGVLATQKSVIEDADEEQKSEEE